MSKKTSGAKIKKDQEKNRQFTIQEIAAQAKESVRQIRKGKSPFRPQPRRGDYSDTE